MEEETTRVDTQSDGVMQDRNELKVSIKNFRSIEQLNLTLGNITQLIGRNNSGKSNICLAIKKAINNEAFEDSDYLDPSQPIEITIEHGGKPYEYSSNKEKNKKKVSKPPIDIIYLPAFPDTDDVTSSTNTKVFGKTLQYFKPENINLINNILAEASKEIEKLDRENLTTLKDSLLKDIRECELPISNIDYSPTVLKSEDILKKRVLMLSDEWKKELDWNKWGHGTQRLLILLSYLQLAKISHNPDEETLLIIEEPEIFMHPQQQRALANKLFKEASNPNFKILTALYT